MKKFLLLIVMACTALGVLAQSSVISGNVTDTVNGTVVSGDAYLYHATNSSLVDAVLIDSAGDYTFSNLSAGDYIVKATPWWAPNPWVSPTYFGQDHRWVGAASLSVDGSNSSTGNDILFIGLPAWSMGPGECSGTIEYGTCGSGKTGAVGDPVPGVDISLEQVPGGLVATKPTDAAGFYKIDAMPLDIIYDVYVDVPGLGADTTYQIEITLSDTIIPNVDFFVDTNEATKGIYMVDLCTGIRKLTPTLKEFRLFPNPASSEITVINPWNTDLHFEMIDMVGHVIQSENIVAIKRFSVDVRDVENGVYFLRISNETSVLTRRVIVN